MKKCYLYETLGSVNEMKVENSNGLMTLTGTFGVTGVRNNNKRVYEKNNYAAMVSEMQKRIKENGAVPGELEHPQGMNINLENISHKITSIEIDEEGVVRGTIQLLNTPKGKIAQSIVEGGLPLFVSSRATGLVDKLGNVKLENLATYDLVGSPGFSQAKMHLNESQLFESIDENMCMIVDEKVEDENKDTIDMEELKKIQEELAIFQEKIRALEEENEVLREQIEETADSQIDLQGLAEGIQKWIVEEYSPTLEKWMISEFKDNILEGSREDFIDNISPILQKWIVEEFGTNMKDWVAESYSKQVEDWVLESVAPGIQDWMVNHFAPEVENWLNEDYSVKIGSMISEGLKDDKNSKLKSISETLSLLESIDVRKPVYGGHQINENMDEPLYISSMPDSIRPKYNMASAMVKESIARRAKISDLSSPEKIERFWENINFDEIKPVENVFEGLENIENERERAIRAAFRKRRMNL